MSGTSSDRLRSLLEPSGLFDEAFYAAHYGPTSSLGGSLLDHFVHEGLARGYMPAAAFDPLVYGYLVPESRRIGPVAHFLESGGRFTPPALNDLFPGCRPRDLHAAVPSPHDPAYTRACRTYAPAAARRRAIEFTCGDHGHALQVPDGLMFLDRLRTDRPFAFARLPHGLWDGLIHRDEACERLAEDDGLSFLSPLARRSLATRVVGAFLPANGIFFGSFLEELEQLVQAHRHHPAFHRAVAFKGYPTPDEGLFLGWGQAARQLAIGQFARFFEPSDVVFDATLWKRMAVDGSLAELPERCRGRHVILVASDLFGGLDDRWELPSFSHVVIPRQRSHCIRWELEQRLGDLLRAAGDGSGPRPIVLTQCGGSLAFWLIARLFRTWPEVFAVDLGQALNAWFLDVPDIPVTPWMHVYRPTIVRTPGFASFYRDRLGGAFQAWLATLDGGSGV